MLLVHGFRKKHLFWHCKTFELAIQQQRRTVEILMTIYDHYLLWSAKAISCFHFQLEIIAWYRLYQYMYEFLHYLDLGNRILRSLSDLCEPDRVASH
jgi:hypothetical protein